MPQIIPIDSADDPRIDTYRNVIVSLLAETGVTCA